jgi:hypothetical protein
MTKLTLHMCEFLPSSDGKRRGKKGDGMNLSFFFSKISQFLLF